MCTCGCCTSVRVNTVNVLLLLLLLLLLILLLLLLDLAPKFPSGGKRNSFLSIPTFYSHIWIVFASNTSQINHLMALVTLADSHMPPTSQLHSCQYDHGHCCCTWEHSLLTSWLSHFNNLICACLNVFTTQYSCMGSLSSRNHQMLLVTSRSILMTWTLLACENQPEDSIQSQICIKLHMHSTAECLHVVLPHCWG